ncbi:MAG: PPA1309 family protein [Marmoricola sp.]
MTEHETPLQPSTLAEQTGPLYAVLRELEAHASETGWDQPERLFAIAETADLVRREPQLAALLGLEGGADAPAYTPIEQDQMSPGQSLEDVLAQITWPPEVVGVAAVAERLVLPPGVEDIPEDPAQAAAYAAAHPDRQEVRIVAAALRNGESACALRLRSHDSDELVLTGEDLVPGLLTQLHATLDLEETAADE